MFRPKNWVLFDIGWIFLEKKLLRSEVNEMNFKKFIAIFIHCGNFLNSTESNFLERDRECFSSNVLVTDSTINGRLWRCENNSIDFSIRLICSREACNN